MSVLYPQTAGRPSMPSQRRGLPPGFRPTGLDLDAALDVERWRQIGLYAATMTRATQWWLGDWLFFGETHFAHSEQTAYEEAVAATGLDYQTLANYKSVAGTFHFSRRRETLSFGHHEAVAGIDDPADQELWLQRAEDDNLGVHALRQLISEWRSTGREPAPGTTLVPFTLRTDEERVSRWRAAAAAAGVTDARGEPDLRTWVMRGLDVLAEQILGEAAA